MAEDGGPVGKFGGSEVQVVGDAGGAAHVEVAVLVADVPTGGEIEVVVARGLEDHGRAGFAPRILAVEAGAGVDAVEGGGRAEGGLHAVVDLREGFGGHETFAYALLAGDEDGFPAVRFDGGEHGTDTGEEMEILPAQDVAGAWRGIYGAVTVEKEGGGGHEDCGD